MVSNGFEAYKHADGNDEHTKRNNSENKEGDLQTSFANFQQEMYELIKTAINEALNEWSWRLLKTTVNESDGQNTTHNKKITHCPNCGEWLEGFLVCSECGLEVINN